MLRTKKAKIGMIYMRISVYGNRISFSINHSILVKSWDSSLGRLKPNEPEAGEINAYIELLHIPVKLSRSFLTKLSSLFHLQKNLQRA